MWTQFPSKPRRVKRIARTIPWSARLRVGIVRLRMQRNPVNEMRFPASLSEVTRGSQASVAYLGAGAYMRAEIGYAISAVLRSAFDDERIVGVDPQFQELAKEIAESVTAAVTKSIEMRLTIHLEGVKDQVQRAAEGYGATLESIDRRLDRLEKDWNKNFRLHSSVLKNHADRIDTLEKRG